jgi:mono/diheme cytochrome c family protein
VARGLRQHADMHTTKAVRRALAVGICLAVGLAALLLFGTPAGAAPPDGRVLYVQRCAVCHGRDGSGDGPDATLFLSPPRDLRSGYLATHSTAEAVRRVLDGRSERFALDLPALRERIAEVDSVTAHLRHIPEVDWTAADQGQVLFATRCAACHGPFGRPGGALPAGSARRAISLTLPFSAPPATPT